MSLPLLKHVSTEFAFADAPEIRQNSRMMDAQNSQIQLLQPKTDT
jgi:hypothetical protein